MSNDQPTAGWSRREVIRAGGAGALAVGAAGALAACGSGSTSATSSGPPSAGKPVHGGMLTIGMLSAGQSETLIPGHAFTPVDIWRIQQLFDPLYFLGSDEKPVPYLAESAEPNADGTVWTVKVRSGVTWHDGKPLTADDVAASLKSLLNKNNYYSAAGVVTYLDAAGVRARGPLTVEVPFKIPIADFPGCFAYLAYYVVRPEIYDKGAKPIGTGPFKYESFTPGKSSTFVANKDYWGGAPYVDQQIVNSSFTDENARANALLSGSIDILPSMVPALAKANASNSAIYIEHASGSNTFYIQCRVDLTPFKDPRVMVALKMLCDRQQMVESVFSGYADEGNDLIGPGLPYYAGPDVFPIRKYDPEQAKSLLKAAGYDNLKVTQYTSALSPGWVEGATDYAQQAAKGGVQVKLVNVNPSIFSTPQGPAGGYGKYPMYSDAPGGGSGVPSLTQQSLILFLSTAPYNGNHFGDAQTDKVLLDAVGELDHTKAQEKWTAFQKIVYERGGSIVYGVPNYLDGYAKRVRGVRTTAGGPVNNFNVSKAWLAK